MAEASLTISSKNYSSWSLRGFLLCRMAGLDFDEKVAPWDDPSTRAELLLLSPAGFTRACAHEPFRRFVFGIFADRLADLMLREDCSEGRSLASLFIVRELLKERG